VNSAPRILALGFDAAPGDLVLRWAETGELPVLQRLIEQGATAPLTSVARYLPESIWPTLATGYGPGGHGVYNWRETTPQSYVRGWRPLTWPRSPFWEQLRNSGQPASGAPRALLLDMHGGVPNGDEGVSAVFGWGHRGAPIYERHSSPPDEFDRVVRRHGRYAQSLNREVAGRPLLERAYLRTLERMVERRRDVLEDLMSSRPWEVCGAVFYEAHYAGHVFHQYAKADAYPEQVPPARGLGDALLRVYQAVDRAIGSLIAAAPDDTHIAVFSGMGLRPNTNGLTLLPRALEALGYTVPVPPSRGPRLREQVRRVALATVPRPVARTIRRRLMDPAALDRHLERLWLESTDWERTRAWAEAEQGSGFIKLNVAGREPAGIVQPGREYEQLCSDIGGWTATTVFPLVRPSPAPRSGSGSPAMSTPSPPASGSPPPSGSCGTPGTPAA
jgi:predicted AlkP superfamily phosphohydrolase/phosphomutase